MAKPEISSKPRSKEMSLIRIRSAFIIEAILYFFFFFFFAVASFYNQYNSKVFQIADVLQ